MRSDQGKMRYLDILFRLKHRLISGRPELPRLAAVNLKEAAQAIESDELNCPPE